ncbi:hypothetical protein C0992_003094 [Termitomyces sp. T32_za158]|nr:hypothetical protein C0992_003094 [Termitomyces sp. T32_za158]
MERSGPVAAAVHATDYTNEDKEDGELGGSSVEEAMEELPSYLRPEVATNGYAKHVLRASTSDGMQPDPDASTVSHMNRQPSGKRHQSAASRACTPSTKTRWSPTRRLPVPRGECAVKRLFDVRRVD